MTSLVLMPTYRFSVFFISYSISAWKLLLIVDLVIHSKKISPLSLLSLDFLHSWSSLSTFWFWDFPLQPWQHCNLASKNLIMKKIRQNLKFPLHVVKWYFKDTIKWSEPALVCLMHTTFSTVGWFYVNEHVHPTWCVLLIRWRYPFHA